MRRSRKTSSDHSRCSQLKLTPAGLLAASTRLPSALKKSRKNEDAQGNKYPLICRLFGHSMQYTSTRMYGWCKHPNCSYEYEYD